MKILISMLLESVPETSRVTLVTPSGHPLNVTSVDVERASQRVVTVSASCGVGQEHD